MQFPSVAALSERAKTVLLRFPWPLAAGAVAAAAAIIGSNTNDSEEKFWVRLCLVAILGIPLTFALSILSERRRWTGVVRTSLIAVGVLGLYWFFWTWPGPEQKHLTIRYLQLSAAIHLAAAFLPFWGIPEGRGFWQYNRRLFEGFLRAVLFSGVLFFGLAIALGALDKLFGVDLEEETYLRLWFVCAFVVNTWIFLAGVPESFAELEESESYPKALKVFTQYILTPLVAVYLVILTAYLVKILVTGTWPSGWIGYLVSSVASVGILGFLLVHPLRTSQSEAWIRTFSRWLFVGLIPAAAMFLLALWKRVGPYGLTELRFLGLLLGSWLLGIALLYTVRREMGIRIIPVSLAVILFLTAFGPLGSTAMSVRSQADRIREISESSNIRITGDLPAGQAEMASVDRREMSEALRFLLERNAVGTVRGLFGERAGRLEGFDSNRSDQVDSVATLVMESLGLKYVTRYDYEPADYLSVERQVDGEGLAISGFDYVVVLSGNDSTRIVLGTDTMQVIADSFPMRISVRRAGDTLLAFELQSLVDSLLALEPPARGEVALELIAESGAVRGMLALGSLNAQRKDGKIMVSSWRGELYLDLRDACLSAGPC
jgi:hypothetical protein